MIKNNASKLFEKLPIKLNPYILAVTILIIIIIITLSGRRSFEDTYDAYIDAVMSGDAEAVVDLLHDSYISNLIEKGEIESKYDLIQKVQLYLDWYNGQGKLHSGEDGDYIAELKSVKDQDMNEEILPVYLTSLFGDSIDKVKAAKYVSIYYTCYYSDISDSNKERTIYTESIYFVKIGHSWYLGQIARY